MRSAQMRGFQITQPMSNESCTGQSLTVVDVSAWQDQGISTIILRGKPALAGELCVRSLRSST